MSLILLPVPSPVFAQGGELKTDSRKVAAAFGLKHFHVMRDIQKIIAQVPEEFSQSKFGLSKYTDRQGKSRPMYEMTEQGFMLLVMGYSTRDAMRIKVAYIQAFDHMRRQLDRLNTTVMQKLLAAIEAEKQSFAVASLAGRLLRERQELKPVYQERIRLCQEQMQPLLTNFETP